MTTIRLAIAGMGNCASSLVQGITYYADADPSDRVPGLMHVELGGYHVRDIKLVAAFDASRPTFSASTSNAATSSMSRMWYPPRTTCIRPGTRSDGSASA